MSRRTPAEKEVEHLRNRVDELEAAEESRNIYQNFRIKLILFTLGIFILAWLWDSFFS